jgi:FkbM family methyltransferase
MPSARLRSVRLDVVEALLLAAFAAFTAWVSARHYYSVPTEARGFRAIYGASVSSQYDEEIFIRDFFNGKRNGVFVDVGANDYRKYNNTYYLENVLGWSGLAIDALHEFASGYAAHRPRTQFFSFFVSDKSDERARFWVEDGDHLLSSAERDVAGAASTVRDVPTITLNDLLGRAGVQKVDFLSMDIELAEVKALAGFDIRRYRPALVCIEAHLPVRQAILDYFARNAYVVVGRYLRADTRNLYFAPLTPTE